MGEKNKELQYFDILSQKIVELVERYNIVKNQKIEMEKRLLEAQEKTKKMEELIKQRHLLKARLDKLIARLESLEER